MFEILSNSMMAILHPCAIGGPAEAKTGFTLGFLFSLAPR